MEMAKVDDAMKMALEGRTMGVPHLYLSVFIIIIYLFITPLGSR